MQTQMATCHLVITAISKEDFSETMDKISNNLLCKTINKNSLFCKAQLDQHIASNRV